MKTTADLIEETHEKFRLRGYHTARGAYNYLLKAASRLAVTFIAIGVIIKLTGCTMDDTDAGRMSPSGMSLFTDAKTGVQYLSAGGSLTPRIDRDGKLMIQNPEKP